MLRAGRQEWRSGAYVRGEGGGAGGGRARRRGRHADGAR